ncbi:MAG TPA: hypothetical protein VM118_04405 [Acidobacteriota bacterium]|nr:hypothetical protein [Acidobacteriota bacterium]
MIVEDYTTAYYETVLHQPTPDVRTGKFLHIVGPDDEYLVLSPTELTKFHAHIVKRFCGLHEDLSSSSPHSQEEILIDQRGWRVRGGGRFRLDQRSRTLTLWGSSKAYGAFNGAHIQEHMRDAAGYEGYAVHIDE